MKKFALAAMVILTAIIGSLSPAANAHAVVRNWTWTNTATQLCLDSNRDGDVYTHGCNQGVFQYWGNSQNQFGDVIVSLATYLCLDSNTGGDVYAIPCNGGNFQRWG